MRLTRRGKVVLLTLFFSIVVVFGVLTAPYGIDYSHGVPRIVDLRDMTRNTNHQ